MRLRLDRAKQLMRNRSLTLLEIALECGFASHAHLSYAFRQRFGLVPSQFRRDLYKFSDKRHFHGSEHPGQRSSFGG